MSTHPNTPRSQAVGPKRTAAGSRAGVDAYVFRASAIQRRWWAHYQLQPNDAAGNIAARLLLRGTLDHSLLSKALNEIVARHEALRTNLAEFNGVLQQRVSLARSIELPVTAFQSNEQIEEYARRPFNLPSEGLFRAALFQSADSEHILLLSAHRSVCDVHSLRLISSELGAFYGTPVRLPALTLQYADHTIWQEEDNFDSQIAQDRDDYWAAKLADLHQVDLIPDFARLASNQPARFETLSRILPESDSEQLRRLSAACNSPLIVPIASALKVLLQRHTGETDIAIGSYANGRCLPEAQGIAGAFDQPIVLRSDLSQDLPVAALLDHVKASLADALRHSPSPETAPFSVCLDVEDSPVKTWAKDGLELAGYSFVNTGSAHDLNFRVTDNGPIELACEYNALLYRPDRMARLMDHFHRLLMAMLAHPESTVSRLPLLDATELSELLVARNNTAAPYPAEAGVHTFIEAQAKRTPDAVAIVCDGAGLTYAKLNERAEQMAAAIQAKGVKPGSLVGIALDRKPELVIAAIAIWKAGAAYVPLDPGFPPSRLEFMASDASLQLLITNRVLADVIPTAAPKLFVEDVSVTTPSNTLTPVSGADKAYVLYTSGSTGKPKGVTISHSALSNLLWAVVKEPGIRAADAIAAVTTLSFDIAGLELFAPLLVGGRVILVSREQASDGSALRQLITASGATILQATPATWRMLIETGWDNTPQLKMLCGGEPLTRDLADAMLKRGGELWNMYGPTETTIWSSWEQIHNDGEPITIGKPAANTTFYILDSNLQPVPDGAPGELFIGGAGVALGYWNRPDLTGERFIDDPFGGSGKIYRTGDRARYRSDGRVEMLGRVDRQVKVRGYRIELGEVEAALTALPDVNDAAVVIREDASGEMEMIGYFVPGTEAVTPAAVRRQLAQRLPGYMVPGLLFALQRMPKTPNHKTDRNALPAPEALRQAAAGDPAASLATGAVSPLEKTLTEIWEKVLRVRPIRRDDNFFELGGHSVLAAQMFARMEKALGKALPLATLFQAPTIGKLCALLEDGGWNPPWSALVPIKPSGSRTPLFLVHPIGGNIINMVGFASKFDIDQPLYGLQARGLDGKEAPNLTVEAMARDYIAQIRSVQPLGPYHLGGFSAGGIVAFEMARQLVAQGEKVGLLGFLDTAIRNRAGNEDASTKLTYWWRTMQYNVGYSFRVGPKEFLSKKIRNWKMRANIRLWQSGRLALLNVEEAFLVAVRDYAPEPFSGQATLFRSQDELNRLTDQSLGWERLIQGGLTIRLVSGDHDTILSEPHIGVLAREISSCLEESRSPDDGANRKPSAGVGRADHSFAVSAAESA